MVLKYSSEGVLNEVSEILVFTLAPSPAIIPSFCMVGQCALHFLHRLSPLISMQHSASDGCAERDAMINKLPQRQRERRRVSSCSHTIKMI